jgi:dsRNA-specific ribonuclease
MQKLKEFKSLDISNEALFEAMNLGRNDNVSAIITCGTYMIKHLSVLGQFLETKQTDPGEITQKTSHTIDTLHLAEKMLSKSTIRFLIELNPDLILRKYHLPVLLKLLRLLVGDMAIQFGTCRAAVVLNAIVGGFPKFLESETALHAQFKKFLELPDPDLPDSRLEPPKELHLLEYKMDYQFQDKSLLEDALSQMSAKCSIQGRMCQRLETLGDSMIDLLVLVYFMEELGVRTDNELGKFHDMVVGRKALTAAAVHVGLDQYLSDAPHRSSSSSYWPNLNKMANKFIHGEQTCPKTPYWMEINCDTKVVCDLYESVIAAVYLDSRDLKAVQKVFNKSLRSIIRGRIQ